MTPQRWMQVRQIFEEAVDRQPNDRAAYLRVVCTGDEQLRREVDSLLASHEDSGHSFLETPAANLPHTLLFGALTGNTLGNPESPTLAYNDSDPGDYPEGYRLGPYQLQRCLGRGGMGAVWAATRVDNEFDKTVAIKLVRRGLDSHEILRRFRNERQMLAALDHPNVARLLDGGSTPDGLPYLVMEYVEGTRIDHYCDQNKLSISDRLRLFRDVCAAVQYAHQNLIIHRDIKPGNILVTRNKQVKLLDFGIAKLVRQNMNTQQFQSNRFASMDLQQTMPNQTPMTLDYASPEQVRGDPVSTASDVYSLGVLLYKLFTARSPYASAGRSTMAIQNAICELEPPRPSAVVLTDDRMQVPEVTINVKAASAIQTQSVPRAIPEETRARSRKRLRKKLSGDLDSIVLKALRKEQPRRYASVEQFSEDVRRYLEGKPVRARTGTFGYRTGKFLRRNKAGVAATLAILIALGASAWSMVAVVRAERDRAERKLSEARRAAHAVLEAGVPATQALELAKAIYGERPLDPAGRADMALAEARVGDEFVLGGDRAQALPHYRASLTLLGDTGDPLNIASVNQRMGNAQFQLGDLLGAMASFSRAAQVASDTLAKETATGKARPATRLAAAQGFERMGVVLFRNGARFEGLATLRKALAYYEEVAAEHPQNAVAQSDLALAQAQLGGLLADSQQYAEAIDAQRKAVQRLETLVLRDRSNRQWQRAHAEGLARLTTTLLKANRLQDARPVTIEAIAAMKPLVDLPDAAAEDLSRYCELLVSTPFQDLRQPAVALQYAQKAVSITRESDPEVLVTLANALEANGDPMRAAEARLRAATLVASFRR